MKRNRTIIGRAALSMAAVALLALGPVGSAQAEKFPSKPIQLIVPWSAGGGSDTAMRLVADAASKRMGVPVVVVNKPGAGGALGTRAMATAKPDGYTIGMVGSGVIARQYLNPAANVISDLQPIVFFGSEPSALSARADTGFKNVADFIRAAKAHPGAIKNGNDTPGGVSYIAIAIIEKTAGIKVTRVPYKGFAPTVAAMLAGEVQTCTVNIPDVIEHHKAGKLRILGVMGEKRHFLAPDVPTFKEQGINIVFGIWRMLVGPKGIPAARRKFLEAKLLETLNSKDFQARARKAGFNVTPMGSAAAQARLIADDKALYPVLLEAGLVKTRKK
jgi:putative tricarboxylic transport membrane protein